MGVTKNRLGESIPLAQSSTTLYSTNRQKLNFKVNYKAQFKANAKAKAIQQIIQANPIYNQSTGVSNLLPMAKKWRFLLGCHHQCYQ